jgi:hypothetical protein
MKLILAMLVVSMLTGCTHGPKPIKKKSVSNKKVNKVSHADTVEKAMIQYTDQQLELFLDSIGHLPTQPLASKVAFGADSVFKNLTKPVNRQISPTDFEILKNAAHSGMIEAHTAKKIFGEFVVDSSCTAKGLLDSVRKGSVYFQYYPFDTNKNKFDEFAVRVGDQSHCNGSELYFFKGTRIIAKQDGYSRLDDISYFKGADGESFIYRIYEFSDGSGIWWNNYFFYKYDGDKLIPVLNELENGNMQSFWGARVLWLESTIQKTNPLTIKMVYYGQFYNLIPDSSYVYGPRLIDDSTVVKYAWDKHTKTLQGQYNHSKITQAQVLTYYLVDNELLFINTYYKTIKASLLNKKKRKWTLGYLNLVKNRGLK